MKRFGALSIAALGAITVCGQGGLSGPDTGFLFDGLSKTVRLMRGSIGSTTLGDPVLDRVDFASISPSGNHAIACRRGDCFSVADLASQTPSSYPISSVPEGVAWAADGSSAVVYSRIGGWLQTVKAVSGEPEMSQVWNVPIAPLLAVAYSGSRTIISTGGETGGIFEVTSTGGLLRLADSQSAIALTIAAKSDTLYALDAASPAVIRVPLKGGPSDRWEVPLSDPLSLQLGPGTLLYVSGGSDQALLALDSQTGQVHERTDLAFHPSRLEPLPGGGFLLTSRTGPDSMLWSFVPNRGTYFIPAPPPLAEDVPARGRRR